MRIPVILVLIILFSGYSIDANAQFWKKLFGKEEKYERRKPAKPKSRNIFPTPEQPIEKKRPKRKSLDYPGSSIKKRYRIDVLIPLYLDELVKDGKPAFKGRLPEKAAYGLDFYEGLKLAADTLNEFSYNLDVYVHDIASPDLTIEKLIQKKTLDSSNLIIGAFPSQYIAAVAEFAKKKEINFISALSPSDGDVADNPYFILLQPKFKIHCERLREMVEEKHPKKSPIIIYRTSANNDDIAYSYFSDLESKAKILCNNPDSIERLRYVMDSTETNIIVMPLLDVSYAAKLLTAINDRFPQYKIEIFGMPSWEAMNELRKGDYANMAVYFTAPFYFDISSTAGKGVADRYKKVAGNVNPSEMVYRGYETMYWYVYLLTRYGTIFNEKLRDNGTAPFTRFDIKPVWDEENDKFLYYENKHLYLYRYQGGSFMVESE